MSRSGRRLRRALLPAVATVVLGPAIPAGAITTVLEAEGMATVSGSTTRYEAASASGGAYVRMLSNGVLAGSVTTPAADRLVLRLRGDQFKGAPQALVRVDGVRIATLAVSATTWTDYTVVGAWAAGARRVQVEYPNDHRVAGVGDRNLSVDRVAFADSAPTPAPAPAPSPLDDAYEARIVELVNVERAKVGLKPLTVSPCADSYAEDWSATMASTGQFAHRTDLAAVMRACSARAVGENIAYGNVDADQMTAMWMGSAGHRANILNPQFTHIGVGATTTSTGRTYGTQNFLTL